MSYLGKNIEDDDNLMVKVTTISDRISKKKTQFENMRTKIAKLTDLNTKLTHGYELSMKMVVDVSKLLQNYTKMFDDIEGMLASIDDNMGIQQGDIKYISNLTKESIMKIRNEFNQQYPSILQALQQQGTKENIASANKLKAIVNELPSNIEQTEKQMIVGGRKSHLK
jgi:predicted FMN-binding regulatory protein PaiB